MGGCTSVYDSSGFDEHLCGGDSLRLAPVVSGNPVSDFPLPLGLVFGYRRIAQFLAPKNRASLSDARQQFLKEFFLHGTLDHAAGATGWISRSRVSGKADLASSRSKSIWSPSQNRSEVPK